jgi:hypothetical protein
MAFVAKLLTVGAVGAALALAVPPTGARADDPPSCSAWDVEYGLSANLKITDTTMGAGDGVFPVGPGRAVVRFDSVNGGPGGHARLTSYAMHERVTITSKAAFWSATVTTETNSKAADGTAAEGTLQGSTLSWSGPMRGYATDGKMSCGGSLCGKFGAPPPGDSTVHMPARSIPLAPFQYGKDMKTFAMSFVQVSQSDGSSSPKQTSFEAVSGREVKRTCVP